tara:strand:- start:30 stop:452 length:423 start_codon:yes stop_codon:yes gene_type:complete
MNKLAYKSQIILDLIPPVISSAAANITTTPTALRIQGSDVWSLSNVRSKIMADVVLDAVDTIDVQLLIKRTDRDGFTSTLGGLTVNVVASDRGQAESFWEPSFLDFDDIVWLETETLVLGTANYQVYGKIDIDCPFQVTA